MEEYQAMVNREDQIELPPGFRFHPTDEELITHYLSKKFVDNNFDAKVIGEVDLNKCEPWDLPWKAKMGEKEWYFFCVRDRKYPTGLRTNRATESGYWKATGKDKEIYRGKALVGMKKTLVFYKGRAPKGEKTNWIMHEYRLEGNFPHHNFPKDAKSEWVICRIFRKSSCGKKTPFTGLLRISSFRDELGSSLMPPLMESPYNNMVTSSVSGSDCVTCFSNGLGGQKIQGEMNDSFTASPSFFTTSTNPSDVSLSTLLQHKTYLPTSLHANQGSLLCSSSAFMQDHTVLRALLGSHESSMMKQACKPEGEFISLSQETGSSADMNPDISSLVTDHQMGRRCLDAHELAAGPLELDNLWNY